MDKACWLLDYIRPNLNPTHHSWLGILLEYVVEKRSCRDRFENFIDYTISSIEKVRLDRYLGRTLGAY